MQSIAAIGPNVSLTPSKRPSFHVPSGIICTSASTGKGALYVHESTYTPGIRITPARHTDAAVDDDANSLTHRLPVVRTADDSSISERLSCRPDLFEWC